jgi:peptide chain release factor 3
MTDHSANDEAVREISRRRTFAIISHPDAGKTTLTEKFRLYGGAVQLDGSVTARRNQRATTSDWMELEKQRGISVSSTVLQFDYGGYVVNLLDTPGHQDFSEDTYRVLTAVDAAVMVIDAAKGIEPQTRKLFEVCRQRGVPIFTFMNKLDRPARAPLQLLDELETVLGIHAAPCNWPLGDGPAFRGVYDRLAREVHLFEKTPQGAFRAPEKVAGTDDELVQRVLAPDVHARFLEEIDLLDGAGVGFEMDALRAGRQTAVFFGSAMNNFGVRLLLDRFLEFAPPPSGRMAARGLVEPAVPAFSGFVFKVQANMNPRHRDRVAFVRVVSGRFRRDMTAHNPRTGRDLRLSNAQRLFARERETVDDAWPGDVVGLVGNHDLQIGDTLSEDSSVVYHEIPRFPPECFAFVHCGSSAMQKRFRAGIEQLLKEGVAQRFHQDGSVTAVPLLGAVGPLQFDVLRHRLLTEYGAECRLETAGWSMVRWLPGPASLESPKMLLPTGVARATDAENRPVLLFDSEWALKFFRQKHPGVELGQIAPPHGAKLEPSSPEVRPSSQAQGLG